MTKRKTEERVKELERNIRFNKGSTEVSQLNNKSLIQINFNDVEKPANYNNLNYTLMREAIEITTGNSVVYNDILHATIAKRWRHLLNSGKRKWEAMKANNSKL